MLRLILIAFLQRVPKHVVKHQGHSVHSSATPSHLMIFSALGGSRMVSWILQGQAVDASASASTPPPKYY